MSQFKLQFDISEIPALAARYEMTLGHLDSEAFARAANIVARKGKHTKETLADLVEVMRWKSHLGLHHFKFNTDEEVFEALDIAMDTEHERTAIAVLCGLEGFGVPMASAVLTALQGNSDDERFTIIDWRALEALGRTNETITLPLYLDYLDFIFELKERTGYSLRMIDRALWQWSFEHWKEPKAA
jgi:hypothetical protein